MWTTLAVVNALSALAPFYGHTSVCSWQLVLTYGITNALVAFFTLPIIPCSNAPTVGLSQT